MSHIAIRTENLSKLYRIGERQGGYRTLRETIVDKFFSPFRHLLRNPQSAIRNPQSESIWALKNVSLEVKRGEVVGIIGRNGAGKTTLLRILSRITEPTEGWAEIRGRVGSLLEVGTGFHPELTGRENIYLNGAILGMHKVEIDRKFDEIVDFAEMEKFIDTPVKRYSSGMRVRLAFAVAAHLEPEILVIDEVLAVGDAAFQKKCLGKMGSVAKDGRTVLFVSHNMGAIQRLCSNCILLDLGQIVTKDKTAKAIERYLLDDKRSPAIHDLYEVSRERDLGSRARISQCRIFDATMNPTNCLAFGEPFTIEVTCKVLKPIEELSFLVGIDSIYEQRIVTVTSLEVGKVFTPTPNETVTGRLRVTNLLLKPGVYLLTLGLFAPNEGIDRVPNAVHIEIKEVSKGHYHVDQVTVGFLQIADPQWEIVRCPSQIDS